MAPVLETKGLVKRFGGLIATDNVSFRLEQGARHALIGPNGAGKTTFINLLTGVFLPTQGEVLLRGRDITTMQQAERVKLGIARLLRGKSCWREKTSPGCAPNYGFSAVWPARSRSTSSSRP